MASRKQEMSNRDIVNYLLVKESEISNKVHNTVTEILRHGYNTEQGKAQVPDMIESIQYILEDIERIVNR